MNEQGIAGDDPQNDYLDDDNEYDDDQEDEGAWLDCGLMPDGQCASAGTEYCDFSCPYRDSEDFAGSEAWLKKHKPQREAREA